MSRKTTDGLRVALVQQTASHNKQANLEKGLCNLEEAARNNARLVCYAELAFERFWPQVPANKYSPLRAETIPGPITEAFANKARQLGVVLVLNLFERSGDRTFDSSPLIDADGSLLGVTRMTHITEYDCFHEQGYYAPGDTGARVYNTAVGPVGVAICYDRHYPEYMRSLALDGANLVIVPQAGAVGEWPDGVYEAEMQVAAFQNGYFTALCNRVGQEEKLEFSGESFVCAPDGSVIGRSPAGEEDILYVDLDLSAVQSSHARKLFLRDRRPELYGSWLGR